MIICDISRFFVICGKNREKIVKNGLSLAEIEILLEKSPLLGRVPKNFQEDNDENAKKSEKSPGFHLRAFPQKHVFELKS